MRLLLPILVSLGFATAQAEARSPGCAKAAAPPPPTRFVVAGTQREAIVVLPSPYRRDRPYPLVVAFHGRTNTNVQARDYFGLEAAASPPAVHVYPAGLRDAAGRFTWSDPGDPPGALRDFALFDTLVGDLAERYCVDLDAVFVVGHSLGASFANSLACARGGQVRAVGSVAGGIDGTACTGRAAALLLHNPADRAVPLDEGLRARNALLGDAEAVPQSSARQLGAFACEAYPAASGPVLWCPYHDSLTRTGRYYPHQWPAGAGPAIIRFLHGLAD
jgi:polyhydroxybutyrate depolymerase